MSIEVAVLLATVAVGLLWAAVLGISALIKDFHHRRHIAAVARRIEGLFADAPKPRPSGRHRLARAGRHQLRVNHA
ncbi:MAG TPA: hypothetical protein VHX38_15065 [Pseudonocardiaceae bacterium]|nr:hypothetical protein [Pseudonocardiaceae bacterium]